MYAVYGWTLGLVLCTFALIYYNFVDLKKHDEGLAVMVERAEAIRSGSKTFLAREYRMVCFVVVVIGAGYSSIQEKYAGVCLLFGAILVLIAEEIGMRGGTYGNVRTTNAARVTKALSRTLRIATLGGSISGFSVPAFGLFGFIIISLICLKSGVDTKGSGFLTRGVLQNAMAARLIAYSLGFSIVAMFNRVGGGTYTKSADIGNDLVSKGEFNLEEDDPRNVCSIADLVGDCIADLASNLTDLGESYVATLMSCTVIAIQNFSYSEAKFAATSAFPIVLAAGGLVSSIVSIMYIILKNKRRYRPVPLTEIEQAIEDGTATEEMRKAFKKHVVVPSKEGNVMMVEYSLPIEDPGKELNNATIASAVITIAIGFIGANVLFHDLEIEGFRFGAISPMLAALSGIVCSVVIGMLTSVYTDTKHGFVARLATLSKQGASFTISEGMAIGNHSAFYPTIAISLSLFLAFWCAGAYGVAIAAVGVLSFVGTTISIDAFGPIADNAGGIAEGCGLDEDVRKITDELDACGNTTAAIGKGNAISAAAFSTITMFMAFIGNLPQFDLNSLDAIVRLVAGMLFGLAVISEFISLLTKNTLAAAAKLAEEAERQLRVPGVLEGKIKPDYNTAIRIASDNALHYMTVPSLLSVVSPIVVGFLLGPIAVLGLLTGATILAIHQAFFNGNAGGAYDNAKKMIEMGLIDGAAKHTPAHLNAIIGDMIGDIMKDVVAVCCDISIKIMATVSVAMAMTFYLHHLL